MSVKCNQVNKEGVTEQTLYGSVGIVLLWNLSVKWLTYVFRVWSFWGVFAIIIASNHLFNESQNQSGRTQLKGHAVE